MVRRRWLGGCALVALLCMTLAGCGGSGAKAQGKTSAHATATKLPTPTITPFPTDIVAPTVPSQVTNCSTALFTQAQMSYGQQGDVLFGGLDFQAPAYPGFQLPSSLPLAPYKVDGSAIGGKGGPNTSWNGFPLSNPSNGFNFMLCNSSATQTHTLSHVSMKVVSFTSYSGTLNEVRTCTMVYSRQGMAGGGCGGASAYDMQLVGAFPANAPTGTEITMQNSGSGGNVSLPATLAPNQMLYIVLQPTLPQLSGTYSYQVGVSIDGGPVAYVAGGTPPALWAPVTHSWSGDNCNSSSMQSQIPPATNPPTYYICPA
ncbi:MAG TPA: hypothetical protein VF120_17580 [Ktedonobacterales bacterium]